MLQKVSDDPGLQPDLNLNLLIVVFSTLMTVHSILQSLPRYYLNDLSRKVEIDAKSFHYAEMAVQFWPTKNFTQFCNVQPHFSDDKGHTDEFCYLFILTCQHLQ